MEKKYLMLIVLLSFVIMSFVVSCKKNGYKTPANPNGQNRNGNVEITNLPDSLNTSKAGNGEEIKEKKIDNSEIKKLIEKNDQKMMDELSYLRNQIDDMKSHPDSTLIKEIQKTKKSFYGALAIALIISVIVLSIFNLYFWGKIPSKLKDMDTLLFNVSSSLKNLSFEIELLKNQPKVKEVITQEIAKADPISSKIDTSKIEEDIQNITKLTTHLLNILEEQKKDNNVIYETIAETCQNNKAELAKESQESKELFETKISMLELELTELKDNVMQILNYVKPEQDIRFHKLQIYFPDRYEIIRKSFDFLETSDSDLVRKLITFIHEFSTSIGIYTLSKDRDKLSMAYEILTDILAQYNLTLILPLPDAAFDDSTMNKDKVFGELNTVHSVVYPGFTTTNHLEKALINVK
ncbi:MAG: hypothetical protein PHC50_01250 [Candidatus Cloacimonetes bacterium]|nr:hypothetical protein [Candidatus Cloacimonadota bacterium]